MLIQDTARASRKALLHLFEISETHFQKLKAAGVFTALDRGTYDLKEAIAGWLAYNCAGSVNTDLTEERRLLTIAQRRRLELELEERKRELVPLADVGQTFNATMVLIGAQLDGLAGRMAGELAGISDPAEVRALLFDECRRIRHAAADKLEDWAAGAQRGSPAETTTPEDTRSVGG